MPSLETKICTVTSSESCQLGQLIQEVWSGYGVIRKATLDGRPVVVKHVDLSTVKANRLGWQSNFSHQRKVRSYEVETQFYRHVSRRCVGFVRVPQLVGVSEVDLDSRGEHDCREIVMVLEDLDAAGFGARKQSADPAVIRGCLRWLAHFHATFMQEQHDQLWAVGTYWHLETRPDEWEAMTPGPVKDFASEIDLALNSARYQTLVHGDAKIANFCFPDCDSSDQVAAVDFQYVGGGVGVKDIAYFVSSCLDERDAEAQESDLLDRYFDELAQALALHKPDVDAAKVESEWRRLYPYAWADFCRFLLGWSPGHWKLNGYSKRTTQAVVSELSQKFKSG